MVWVQAVRTVVAVEKVTRSVQARTHPDAESSLTPSGSSTLLQTKQHRHIQSCIVNVSSLRVGGIRWLMTYYLVTDRTKPWYVAYLETFSEVMLDDRWGREHFHETARKRSLTIPSSCWLSCWCRCHQIVVLVESAVAIVECVGNWFVIHAMQWMHAQDRMFVS